MRLEFFKNLVEIIFTSIVCISLIMPASLHAEGLVANDKERALISGRYGDFIKLAEAETPDISALKTPALYPLCDAYSKVKRYNRLFPCLDQLEKNIQRGDSNIIDLADAEKRAPGIMAMGKFAIAIGQIFGAPSYEESMTEDATPKVPLLRAQALIELGQYARAAEQASKALDFAQKYTGRKDNVRLIRIDALTFLVLANAMGGRRGDALKYLGDLEKAQTVWEAGWDEHYQALAKAYLSVGEFDKALAIMRRNPNPPLLPDLGKIGAQIIVSGITGVNDASVFLEMPRAFMLNRTLFETGNLDEAKSGYDKLLELPQTRHNGEIYWQILFDRGRIAEKEGKSKDAADYYRRAIDVIEEQRSNISTESSKIGFVGDKQAVYARLVGVLFGDGQFAVALEYVERSKSRALVDMLSSRQEFALPAGKAEEIRALLAANRAAEAELQVQFASESATQTRSLAATSRQQLQLQAPELASLVSVSSVPAAEIQSRLPADEAIVEYYANGEWLYIFLVTREELRVVRVAATDLASEVRLFRAAIMKPRTEDYMKGAQELYKRLITPLGALPGRKLVVVAHGPLHYLPFNALHDGDAFLIDRVSIRMLPSSTLLTLQRSAESRNAGAVLAFGNPDLGDSQLDLVHAQSEAVAVGAMFPQSQVFVRNQATESNLKQFGAGFNFIHFATHGEFDPKTPLDSALLLAPDAVNDGRLTVGELYTLNLDANMVTLSACETGLGSISSGDDVVGLTRGFLYAGARSIVSSLWSVDDNATADLMKAFYENLRTLDKREALREAQIRTRQAFPHPFFWAAFQLTGRAD